MRPRFIGLTWLFAVLAPSSLWAQTQADRAHVASTFVRGTSVGQGGSLSDRQQVEVKLPLPPLRFGANMLIPGLGYESRWLGAKSNPSLERAGETDLNRNFQRFELSLMFMRPFGERWRGLLGVVANARTDLQERSFDFGKDTSWVGVAISTYAIGGDPNFNLTLGLSVLYPVVSVPAFPIVGVSYRGDRYVAEVGLPRCAFLVKPTSGLELGLMAAFERQAYRTRLPGVAATERAEYVEQTSLRVGPAVNVDLGANLWLSSSFGLDVLNDIALLDADRESLALSASTEPAPFFRLLVGWRPPRPAPSKPKT
jgi:hypothetical protein